MKKIILPVLCVLVTMAAIKDAVAQIPPADELTTSKGNLSLQPVFHGTLVLKWDNKTIYVDPYNGPDGFKTVAPPDIVLITDIHGDHMDTNTLNKLDLSKSKLIVPQAVADLLPARYKSQLQVLANGKTAEVSGVSITAVPMYNIPDDSTSRHKKGRGNGYVLALGGKRLYISGDTEDIPEMRALKNIDVAFVCMNQPFTMSVDQASSAVVEFKPKIVYPYHYRGRDGLSDTEAFKKMVNEKDNGIDVRLRNWYAK
jgi:L-ascorbate metabolism protein UlaG (beta-lactamase superfamily)